MKNKKVIFCRIYTNGKLCKQRNTIIVEVTNNNMFFFKTEYDRFNLAAHH